VGQSLAASQHSLCFSKMYFCQPFITFISIIQKIPIGAKVRKREQVFGGNRQRIPNSRDIGKEVETTRPVESGFSGFTSVTGLRHGDIVGRWIFEDLRKIFHHWKSSFSAGYFFGWGDYRSRYKPHPIRSSSWVEDVFGGSTFFILGSVYHDQSFQEAFQTRMRGGIRAWPTPSGLGANFMDFPAELRMCWVPDRVNSTNFWDIFGNGPDYVEGRLYVRDSFTKTVGSDGFFNSLWSGGDALVPFVPPPSFALSGSADLGQSGHHVALSGFTY